MAHSHDACATPTPEKDAAIARQALLEGDHRHALHHLAGALAADPHRPEWLVMLEQLANDAGDALALVPETPETWFGLGAVRARLLAAEGRPGQAIALLLRVAAARPDVPYLPWAEGWLGANGAALAVSSTELEEIGQDLTRFAAVFVGQPSPIGHHAPGRRNLEAAAAVAQRLREASPSAAPLGAPQSQILRRLGRPREAVEAARAADASRPSWWTAALLAFALRDAGDGPGAVEALRRAGDLDPSDLSCRLDRGDLLLDLERPAEAAAAYAEVLAREPAHPWALPSHAFAQLQAGAPVPSQRTLLGRLAGALRGQPPPQGWRERLESLVPSSARAAELVERLVPPVPWVTWLPSPADATANVLRQLLQSYRGRESELGDVSLRLSGLEAPSLRLAFERLRAAHGFPGRLTVVVEQVATPDPRLPRRPVAHALWRYHGTEPEPTTGPPPAEVQAAVEALAGQPYRLTRWFDQAVQGRRALGACDEADIAAALAHPPPLPGKDVDALEWVQRCQLAAALLLAAGDGPWAGSDRRAWLLDLLDGPLDWAVGAVATALSEVAVRDPAVRAEVEEAFHQRLLAVPGTGYCCYSHPVVCAYRRTPGLAPALAVELDRVRVGLETA